MIIDVIENYQLRCTDGMNWQVYYFKHIDQEKAKRRRKNVEAEMKEMDQKWVPLPSYHRSVESGVKWILLNMPKNDKYRKNKMTLKSFLVELDNIVKDFHALGEVLLGAEDE